jgi:hypothetical protein
VEVEVEEEVMGEMEAVGQVEEVEVKGRVEGVKEVEVEVEEMEEMEVVG